MANDGRLKELFKICNILGKTKVYDCTEKSLFKYIWKLLNEKKYDYFVVDNRAILPIALLYIFLKNLNMSFKIVVKCTFLQNKKL